MAERKKRSCRKKKDDDFLPEDNSRDDSQSEDPEIQKILEKIEKINDAEEQGAKPSKKRARKSAEPNAPEPAPSKDAPVPAPKTKGKKPKANSNDKESAVHVPWEPAETALLTLLITGQVPVVKLPADVRVTNQYKGMHPDLFPINLIYHIWFP